MLRHYQAALMIVALTACASAPSSGPAGDSDGAVEAITEAEIRADLFKLAGDSMRGREAGTIDEIRASAWIAERARQAGLQPAGDDGTYFQWWNLRRVRLSGGSAVALDGRPLVLWKDIMTSTGPMDATLDAPVVWIDDAARQNLATVDLSGKVAAMQLVAPPNQRPRPIRLAERVFTSSAMNYWGGQLRQRGVVAVLLVADSMADFAFDQVSLNAMRGRFSIDTGQENRPTTATAPIFLVRGNWRDRARSAQRLTARFSSESFTYPSVNVVAKVPGTDDRLRNEYVLFSAHQDHDGVRGAVGGDSIYNGADDNATVAVAVLAIGRAFAEQPGRRSALFVWHGAEERGLIGSRYHAQRPVVPRESIVAVLNADMIGRNHPDTAALLGAVPPHRSSTDLVNMALEANQRLTRFVIDSSWDRPEHPEGWYFRSDHLPYAQLNIPSLYFSSLLHADYHTPFDNPDRIDTAKLTRITKWMFGAGWSAANAAQRPRLDPGFRLER